MPGQVAEDRRFRNMTEVWLAGDHYKWRAMRSNGVAERFCTGDADDYEKYMKWAETVPALIRNPLHHWAHMELKKPFGICDRMFNPETAPGIWNECNEKLAQPEFTARGIMKQFHVALVCTTDDPCDDLEAHRTVNADTAFGVRMLPTWRPDRAMAVEEPEAFNAWTAGSFLADPARRGVVTIARNLLEGAAAVSRAQQLRSYGVPVPSSAFDFRPRELE